jgi:photosystem II stability/assembly factor-like uncharacterized protein
LHRSRDSGATWDPLPELTGVRPLAIWHDPALAIVAGCARVLLSTDEGETWRESTAFDANFTVTALVPVADDPDGERTALVAGTSDRGTTNLWQIDLTEGAIPQMGDPLAQFWGTGAIAAWERRYVAGTAGGVLISPDGGATWALSRDGLEAVTVSVDPFLEEIPADEQARGFGIFAVAIDPADADRLYVGTIEGLYRSVDGGVLWQRLAGVDGRVSAIGIGPTPCRLLAQTDAGVFTVHANA